jgi:tRNA(Arg) A34 adenosine deaminase TadA
MIKNNRINKFEEPIEKMVQELIKNKKSNGGFPIVSIFLEDNFNLISVNANSRSNNGNTDVLNHAEFKCCLDIDNKKENLQKKLIAIITTPPCNDCLKEISKNYNNVQVFYFFDDVRKKIEKNYLKHLVLNRKISKKSPSNFISKNIKYNIYYIILSYLGGCLTQKLNNLKHEEIEKISKKIVKNLKTTIKSNRPSKGQIKIEEV